MSKESRKRSTAMRSVWQTETD